MDDICANCDAPLTGPYCAQCGERQLDPHHLSFKHFVHDAIHEFTHLDGPVGTTLRLLFTRPGALAEAYLAGKRTTLIRPLRLYLIVSLAAIFFMRSSIASLQHLVTGNGPFAPVFGNAIAAAAKAQGISETAYLATRSGVFNGIHNFSVTYISTGLLILGCWALWHRRRAYFGTHAVFVLYASCATDVVMTAATWLTYKISHGNLTAVGTVSNLSLLYMAIYFFLAAKRVYAEGWFRTALKVLLLIGTVVVYSLISLVLSLFITLPLFAP